MSLRLCACGCGQPAPIAKQSTTARGHVKGQPLKFIHGHNARRESAEVRFWSKVDRRGAAECWEWVGCRSGNGYGHFLYPSGRIGLAHRWAYEAFKGPIPAGLTVDHLCRNRACVNPSHLEAVTHRENVLRGVSAIAKNSRKTHCSAGHPYDGANTGVDRGARMCLACRAQRGALRNQARRLQRRSGEVEAYYRRKEGVA